ncbi:hypothetical protein BDR26DRAFT_853314 [Obelidium mucronatum]|nr:hypothetical protein BDR26DRAFT_853314 [Obelidium mucronatum]
MADNNPPQQSDLTVEEQTNDREEIEEVEQDEVINWSDDEEMEAEGNPSTDITATKYETLAETSSVSGKATPAHLTSLPRASSSTSFLSNDSNSTTSATVKSKHRPPILWKPIIADNEVSSYELEREARVAQNRAVLLSLGVLKESSFSLTGSSVEDLTPKPKKSHKKKRRPVDDEDEDEDAVDRYQKMMELKRSKRLQGEGPELIRGGRSSELGNDPEQLVDTQAFSDPSDSENDDDDIFDQAGMIGMSKIRKRKLGAGVDLAGGLNNDVIQVNTPFTLGYTKLTIWSIGEIVSDKKKREDYWSQRHCRYRHQYPVGFKATKSQYGYDWTMTIEEGEDGPLFKVVADDEPDLPEFTGPSPTSPWTEVCMTVLGKNSKTRVSGPHQFGFTDPFLQAVIFGLPNHPRIEDMTTLRLVSRQARRGVRFGGRDGQKKKRGRPRGGNGLMDCLTNNVIVIGGMQDVDWDRVLEEEKEAELARREERRVKEEKDKFRTEGKTGGRRPAAIPSGSHASISQEQGASSHPSSLTRLSMKAEELEQLLRSRMAKAGGDEVEMIEMEVEVEEEIPDEVEDLPRIVNGREFRARRAPKQFRKVIKKVLMPVKKKKVKPEPPTPEPIVTQKILTKLPPEVMKRAMDPEDDVIYCICDLPESDYWNTVACDFCNIWLHVECVGYVDPETIPKSQHHTVKGLMKDGRWKCPRCRKEVLLVKQQLDKK